VALFWSDKLGRDKIKKSIYVAGVKNMKFMGSENDQKRENCYIVVSTFFAKTGPPRTPPKIDIFDPPIGAKVQAFLWGMAFSIGPLFGVDFGGRNLDRFCKKCTNFKKFIKWGSRVPDVENRYFNIILDPQILTFLRGHFGIVFCQFLDPLLSNKFRHFLPPF
jgi:hypothetical protein